ncbi:hypothetical protein A0H81_12416 [Grifola frondosa]|uniref:Uncharacterized protein n=1 Tax=Grifola frondosa TaxID=5627 RepID=A0A1C7LSW2_GRIFR|nr:hypothetical protein A0H81_12416 [Grifola frondosa]
MTQSFSSHAQPQDMGRPAMFCCRVAGDAIALASATVGLEMWMYRRGIARLQTWSSADNHMWYAVELATDLHLKWCEDAHETTVPHTRLLIQVNRACGYMAETEGRTMVFGFARDANVKRDGNRTCKQEQTTTPYSTFAPRAQVRSYFTGRKAAAADGWSLHRACMDFAPGSPARVV